MRSVINGNNIAHSSDRHQKACGERRARSSVNVNARTAEMALACYQKSPEENERNAHLAYTKRRRLVTRVAGMPRSISRNILHFH